MVHSAYQPDNDDDWCVSPSRVAVRPLLLLLVLTPPTGCIRAADYSPEMEDEFCAPEEGGAQPGCRLPTAAERDTPTFGNSMLQWSTGADPSARSFRYNQFISSRIAGAIAGFAAVIKNVTENKAFTMAYNGYLFDLSDSRLTYSGHLALSALLQCPNLDAIASPYRESLNCLLRRHCPGLITAVGGHHVCRVCDCASRAGRPIHLARAC